MKKHLIVTILIFSQSLALANHDSTEWIDAPILEIEIKSLKSGELNTYEWAGLPIFVLKPTNAQLRELKSLDTTKLGLTNVTQEIELASKELPYRGVERLVFNKIMLPRRLDHNVIVLIGLSPYLGCAVYYNSYAGDEEPPVSNFFKNPCRENMYFDLRGRVFKGHNFSYHKNMQIPPFTISKGLIKIGNKFKVSKQGISDLLKTYEVDQISTEHDFFRAIALGKSELISEYLKQEPNLSKQIQGTYGKGTPFLHAIMLKHYDIAALFDKGPKFEQVTSSGNQFGCAMQYYSGDRLQKLFNLGLDPNAKYCSHEINGCSVPFIYESVIYQFSEKEQIANLLLSTRNGLDLDQKHCGYTLKEYMGKHGKGDWYEKFELQLNKKAAN